jgi:uncharacterized glyoxalase superfamily protein PhnB
MNENNNQATVWPCLRYADAPAAIEFLKKAFGFEDTLVVPSDDGEDVVHAELRWPLGGGVMLGTTEYRDGVHAEMKAGAGWVYVVTDEPDALYERAIAAGATEVQGLQDEDYGSRGFTVQDTEGNHWSFGTYRGG